MPFRVIGGAFLPHPENSGLSVKAIFSQLLSFAKISVLANPLGVPKVILSGFDGSVERME